MTGIKDVIRQLVARLGDAADFHFAPKYVDCIVEEYADKIAELDDETCRMVYNDLSNLSRCTVCGWLMNGIPMHYCPNCGRKVVNE